MAIFLEALDHEIALFFGRAAVQEEDFAVEGFLEVAAQQGAHLGKLGEDEGLVALGQSFFEHFFQAGQLAGAAGQAAAVADEVGGMVADLLELEESGEDQALAFDALRVFDLLQHLFDYSFVQRGLFAGQVAENFHLQFIGQVGDDGFIGLETTQDERLDDTLEGFSAVLVAVLLDGDGEVGAEIFTGAQVAGVEELHDRPEFG